MANLKSFKESRPGGSNYKLPYARLNNKAYASMKNEKKPKETSGAEALQFNVAATEMAQFKRGERVNIFWDTENFCVGIFRGGSQRSVQFWGNGKHFWTRIYITSLVRMYEIPFHRHPLPVSCDPDGNVWVDFSGTKAHTKYVPERIRPSDPSLSFTEKKVARLCARLSDHSNISNKTWVTLLELFQEVSRAEGFTSFSTWVENVLSHHVQDHYSHLWETFVGLKKVGNTFMSLHYHVTPITPNSVLEMLAGHCFMVSWKYPEQIKRVHQIGQSVLLDNGAYSFWKAKTITAPPVWSAYYRWCDSWLDYPTTWAIIPDVINGGTKENDDMIKKWPFGHKGIPVWHLDESLDRLIELSLEWPKVCFGSSGAFANVGGNAWSDRMDQAFWELDKHHKRTPWIHMLRGMAQTGKRWPFASVDSSDIGRNHYLDRNDPVKMMSRWDSQQSPAKFIYKSAQKTFL